MFFYQFSILFFLLSTLGSSVIHSMEPKEVINKPKSMRPKFAQVQKENPYDSDSEDEQGYTYNGFADLTIPADLQDKECVPLVRGIHFSPSHFNKKQRSSMRRANDAGKDVYCSAAYDLAKKPLDGSDSAGVKENALVVRQQVKGMKKNARDLFQQIYSNNYDGFHKRLGTTDDGGIFKNFKSKKNPQISTSEDYPHAEKYAFGLKFLGSSIELLKPEYDTQGKPKHPYLGKLSVILASVDRMAELSPYFVVHGHKNDDITVSTHFSKNILTEREASFPGFIPGESVVFSTPLRVPSFKGPYKDYYQEKYGINERSYKIRRTKILNNDTATIKKMINQIIIPHVAEQLRDHVAEKCKEHDIKLVYKQIDGSFGDALPAI